MSKYEEITSISNLYIKFLLKLDSRKTITEQGVFLVEGENIIKENVEKGLISRLLVTEPNVKQFSDKGVEIIVVTPAIIKKLSKNKTNHGIIGVANYRPKDVDLETMDKVLVLENINNPGNLGSIIRTAKAFNFKCIILLGETVFPFNEKVIRSSQGGVLDMPILETNDLSLLKNFNVYHFILDEKAVLLKKVTTQTPMALVFGNEANGISKELLNNLKGENIFIEINNAESLNLSNAAAIAMYEISK